MGLMMSSNEMANYLRMHRGSIWKYAVKGVIPGKKVGRAWRFDKKVIDKWVAMGNNQRKKKKG